MGIGREAVWRTTTTTEVSESPQNARRMSGRARVAVAVVAGALDRLGVISTERFDSTMSLAWPRIVTGFAIMSKQTVDLAFVGIAAGTAGLAFPLAYWQVVAFLGLGLAGGTISLVSQNYGSGETERASLAITQSVLLAVAFAVPIMLAFVLFADALIGLLGADPASLRQGKLYLVFVAPAAMFELLNLIASRTDTGVGDTFTEMVVRTGGAALNVVPSGAFIFGAGMGVVGAALGTTLATGFVTLFGRYLVALPAAALGLVTPLGLGGLYLALLFETYVPGGINYVRFWTGRWKAVSRRYRPSNG
jgi:Na+-driven multidrug efflux pump